jgi:hypothetical protein
MQAVVVAVAMQVAVLAVQVWAVMDVQYPQDLELQALLTLVVVVAGH